MAEVPTPEFFADLFGPFASMMPAGFLELLTATAYAVDSATEGECKECACDVCVSLRGVTAGFGRVMEEL